MKNIRIVFTDMEFRKLMQRKKEIQKAWGKKISWHDLFLLGSLEDNLEDVKIY